MTHKELNNWIAEYAFPSKRWGIKPVFTSIDFHRVKREIERRGWSWQAASPIGGNLFLFVVYSAPEGALAQTVRKIGEGTAETEELAGCLAFKQAVEASEVANASEC